MTADETGQPTLVDFITGRYNGIVFSEGNGNFAGYRFPGFILYFLSQPRWGLSPNRIGADFWFMTIKG